MTKVMTLYGMLASSALMPIKMLNGIDSIQSAENKEAGAWNESSDL